MDHGKRRGDTGRVARPIISTSAMNRRCRSMARPATSIDRRRVSVQWFSGTILTGLCGAALMGGAVFASLDGQSNFATVPERVQLALRGSGDRAATARKADRLPPPSESTASAASSATPRPAASAIARSCASAPSCASPAISRSRPPNCPPTSRPSIRCACRRPKPQPGAAPADESPDAEVDAEVSFVTADLANVLPRAKIAAVLSIDDVLVRVREAANWTGSAPPRHARRPNCRAAPGWPMRRKAIPDPYAGFEARIAPENVTLLPKTQTEATGGTPWSERTVAIRKGETVASVLRELGARPDDIKAITRLLGARGRDGGVRENHKLRVLLAPTERSQIHAADPRRDRERQRHRGGRRLVRSRPLRAGRHPQPRDRSRPRRVSSSRRKRKTTAGACGSIRASTRPRCAIRCRAR